MFSDGRAADEVLQVLSPAAQRVVSNGGIAPVTLTAKIIPTDFFAIQRYTDASGNAAATTVGAKWISDMGGKLLSQSNAQVTMSIPANQVAALASLPLFTYFDVVGAQAVSSAQSRSTPSTSGIKDFLTMQKFGLPTWSWLVIAGSLALILYSTKKSRSQASLI